MGINKKKTAKKRKEKAKKKKKRNVDPSAFDRRPRTVAFRLGPEWKTSGDRWECHSSAWPSVLPSFSARPFHFTRSFSDCFQGLSLGHSPLRLVALSELW